MEDFFNPPQRAGAAISPDGTRIAYLAPWQNRLNIWVQGVDGTDEPRCVTADEDRSVYIFSWTQDSRWLLYMQDEGGNERWHVYRVDPDDPDAPPRISRRFREHGPRSSCSRAAQARPSFSTTPATPN